ncbi:hypothetical protein RM543_16310 [Roseicyclus sp. F158]|uniref:DUF2007 domain-containing protein n=1 Tax=Tropicimonas omnivorans TaxID=3075590 RepID=A0ABU3DKK9_9RHOB|nr:hypothetical protein [Roseicyclus sp. F158]MDT0684249.1 hypothetical protein [Roseicyclus sp. F158]
MSGFTGFARVASAYDPLEVTMAVALLEGASFTVLTPGLNLHQVVPMNAMAFGPIPILVPDAEAEAARSLLEATRPGGCEGPGDGAEGAAGGDAGESGDPRLRGLRSRLVDLVFFAMSGLSFPRDRLSVDGRLRRPPETPPET